MHYYNYFDNHLLLGELMEVVQNGGKSQRSFKTHFFFISVKIQSLIWRTDAAFTKDAKSKGINEIPV